MFFGFIIFGVIAIYIELERREGRIYGHPIREVDRCRPGVRDFLENNKK